MEKRLQLLRFEKIDFALKVRNTNITNLEKKRMKTQFFILETILTIFYLYRRIFFVDYNTN